MKTIACIGDSNTYGYDPFAFPAGRYPKDIRWTGRLSAQGLEVTNLGQNGLSVSRKTLHPLFAQEIRSLGQPDLVTVMLGSNDILLGLTADETGRCMENLLTLLLTERPGEKLLLIAPPPVRPGFWVSDASQITESERLAAVYGELAGALGIRFADAGCWGIPLTADGVHFTAEGHRIFAERLSEEMTKTQLPAAAPKGEV